jgi:uncharacterized protein (TIGR00297 family)
MDRKLNYLFGFLLVFLFITAANTAQQWNILLGVILSGAFAFSAFLLQRLTLDGMFATITAGTFVLGFGGWLITLVVLFFFISSTLMTQKENPFQEEEEQAYSGRRDGLQVWANGFWLMCCLVLAAIFGKDIFLVGALAAVAVATADTWATEQGSKSSESTYLITNFTTVPPGTDGGVSFRGTSAAIAGSLSIAAAALYVFSLQLPIFLIIFVAGFFGCLFDSYFGAIFQRDNRSVTMPIWNNSFAVNNNMVNAVSTGSGALLAIIIKLLLA